MGDACSIGLPFIVITILAVAISLVVVVVGLVLIVLVVTIIAVAVAIAIVGIMATALLRVRHAGVNYKKLLWQVSNCSIGWLAAVVAHLKAMTFAVEQGMG